MVYNGPDVLGRGLVKHLSQSGIGAASYRLHGEPQVEHVDDALRLARDEECEIVIGLGGEALLI